MKFEILLKFQGLKGQSKLDIPVQRVIQRKTGFYTSTRYINPENKLKVEKFNLASTINSVIQNLKKILEQKFFEKYEKDEISKFEIEEAMKQINLFFNKNFSFPEQFLQFLFRWVEKNLDNSFSALYIPSSPIKIESLFKQLLNKIYDEIERKVNTFFDSISEKTKTHSIINQIKQQAFFTNSNWSAPIVDFIFNHIDLFLPQFYSELRKKLREPSKKVIEQKVKENPYLLIEAIKSNPQKFWQFTKETGLIGLLEHKYIKDFYNNIKDVLIHSLFLNPLLLQEENFFNEVRQLRKLLKKYKELNSKFTY